MTNKLSEHRLQQIIQQHLSDPVDAQSIAKAIAVAISENNKRIERELNFIRSLTGK